jgi:phenylalanyl-tRNA synthetase beta chain
VLVGEASVGVVGELHPRVARDRDVVGRLAACELHLDALLPASGGGSVVVRDVPRYPPVRRDLAFVVPEPVAAGDVSASIEEAAGELFARCLLFDVYRGEPLRPGTKSLAYAVDLRAVDRTLTGEETEPVVAAIVERLRDEFGAELRTG